MGYLVACPDSTRLWYKNGFLYLILSYPYHFRRGYECFLPDNDEESFTQGSITAGSRTGSCAGKRAHATAQQRPSKGPGVEYGQPERVIAAVLDRESRYIVYHLVGYVGI